MALEENTPVYFLRGYLSKSGHPGAKGQKEKGEEAPFFIVFFKEEHFSSLVCVWFLRF